MNNNDEIYRRTGVISAKTWNIAFRLLFDLEQALGYKIYIEDAYKRAGWVWVVWRAA